MLIYLVSYAQEIIPYFGILLKKVFHFPVVPDVSYSWSGVPVGGELDLITFRPNPGQTACFIFSRRRKLDVNKMLAQNLVKKQLMKMK